MIQKTQFHPNTQSRSNQLLFRSQPSTHRKKIELKQNILQGCGSSSLLCVVLLSRLSMKIAVISMTPIPPPPNSDSSLKNCESSRVFCLSPNCVSCILSLSTSSSVLEDSTLGIVGGRLTFSYCAATGHSRQGTYSKLDG